MILAGDAPTSPKGDQDEQQQLLSSSTAAAAIVLGGAEAAAAAAQQPQALVDTARVLLDQLVAGVEPELLVLVEAVGKVGVCVRALGHGGSGLAWVPTCSSGASASAPREARSFLAQPLRTVAPFARTRTCNPAARRAASSSWRCP